MKQQLASLGCVMLLASCGAGTAGIFAASDSSSSGSSNAKTTGIQPEVRDEDYEVERALASPAAIHFALTDEEGDPADVIIEFSQDGANFDAITLAPGSASLTQVPSNQDYEVLWDFATDLPNGEGYTGDLTIRLEVVGGISPDDAMDIEVGNDVPVFTPPTFAPEISGIVAVPFSVEDTENDAVEVKIEYQIDGDATWFLARNAEITDPQDTGEAFAVDTDADGDEEVFFWDTGFATAYEDSDGDEVVTEGSDTGVLASREASVRLRFTLHEDFSQAESIETVELVEQAPLLVVDNNAPPQVVFDNALFVNSADRTRSIAIPFTLFDQEGDAVRVVLQWKRETQPGFAELPATVAQIEAALLDPQLREELQICTEAPIAFGGRIAPPPDAFDPTTHVSLPELAGTAAELLAAGIEERTLEILRPSGVLRSTAASWDEHGFANPLSSAVAALPVGSGPTALVLDAPSGEAWRLREIDLATGEALATKETSGPGEPTAMDYEPETDHVVVASHMGSLWEVHRVELEHWTTTRLIGAADADANTELGPIRDIESIGTGVSLITVGESLVRLEYEQPGLMIAGNLQGRPESVRTGDPKDLPARQGDLFGGPLPPFAVTVLQELQGPWGIESDPLQANRIYLAERDYPHDDGRVGRVVTLEIDTLQMDEVYLDGASAVPGAGFERPTAIALERNGSRLLAVTDVNPADDSRELRGIDIASRDRGSVFEADRLLPRSVRDLVSGPDQLRVLASGNDLLVAGGVLQRRMVLAHDPGTRTVLVSPGFQPPPAAGQIWHITGSAGAMRRSSPTGETHAFVWDSADVLDGAIQLRVLPMDTDLGLAIAGEEAKTVSLFEDIRILSAPGPSFSATIAVADLNDDGLLDIASDRLDLPFGTPPQGLAIFYQSAEGRFDEQPSVTYHLFPPGQQSMRAADLNGDGRDDLVAAGLTTFFQGQLQVLQQPREGGFIGTTKPIARLGSDSPWLQWVEGIEIADIDRNGFPDIIASSGSYIPIIFGASTAVDDVAIFYQGSDGGFPEPEDPEVLDLRAEVPRGWGGYIDVADLNSDGWIDLACGVGLQVSGPGNPGPQYALIYYQKDGGFSNPPDARIGPAETTFQLFGLGVSLADIDRSGRQDLVAGWSSLDPLRSEVSVTFQRPGPPGLWPSLPDATYGSGGNLIQTWDALGADIDADGLLDLVTAGQASNSLAIFRQRKGARFSSRADVLLGDDGLSKPAHIETADLNGDGRLDVAVAQADTDTNGLVAVYEQRQPGSFAVQPDELIGNAEHTDRPSQIGSGDLNGDGRTDLVSANLVSGNLTIFYQGAPGRFPADPEVVLKDLKDDAASLESPRAVDLADVNGDGRLDLITTHVSLDAGTPDCLALFLQPEEGFDHETEGTLITDESLHGPRSIVVADFNGDGLNDLAAASRDSGKVTVFTRGRAADFSSVEILGGPGLTDGAISLVATDFDRDGQIDLATANTEASTLTLFIQEETGYSHKPTAQLGGPGVAILKPDLLIAADFDDDGRPDLVSANAASVTLLLQPESGYVSTRWKPGDSNANSKRLHLVDIGVTQVVVPRNALPVGLAAGDLNADGRLDLVVGSEGSPTTPPSTSVFYQRSNTRFGEPVASLEWTSDQDISTTLVITDLNSDGELDLAAGLHRPTAGGVIGNDIFDVIGIYFNGQ